MVEYLPIDKFKKIYTQYLSINILKCIQLKEWKPFEL